MVKRGRSDSEDSASGSEASEEEEYVPTVDVERVSGSNRYQYTNKQRILVIASRGITARHRYFLEDLKKMLPHHKTDNKLDDKGDVQAVNEIADLKSCNQVLYLEARKHQDLYLFLGKTPQGPSVKFHVVNLHTMDELRLTGNAMLGSRPLLNFDAQFESTPHHQLMKAVLSDAFGTPLGHPKSKPFLDRVMSFFLIKNNIWVRNYQIVDKKESGSDKETQLVEIGPRFVLIPIRIFMGSLGGPTLYANQAFITPNAERSMNKKHKGNRYAERVHHTEKRREFLEDNKMPTDELASINVFR
eukprot:gene1503-1637_t